MFGKMKQHLSGQLDIIKEGGLLKAERVLSSAQGRKIDTLSNQGVINLCANNYLGLANHPEIIRAAKEGMDKWGYGLSSVRFICGTQEIHKMLESKISEFLGTEDTILYSSCFDANGGLFETLLSEDDVVISDELNHASIIDGIRLCKAKRLKYRNSDMADLEEKLKESRACRFRLIATDGVFSMDGTIVNLKDICRLAETYDALVMVDDSHAIGVLGENGKGSHEHCGVMGKVDIITGTLGKALGGASGGYTSGRREIIDYLRQRSRPYLFSNTLAPSIACGSLKALEIITSSRGLINKLRDNTQHFRAKMDQAGFSLKPGAHPIVPIMLGDAKVAQRMAAQLLDKGVYVVGFSFPVVPQGAARIRTQISAAHSEEDLDFAAKMFASVV